MSKPTDPRKRGPLRATRPVYLRLPVPLADAVKLEARTRGWTVNRLVETILEDALASRRKRG